MSSINKPSKSSFLNVEYNNLKRQSIAKMNQSVLTTGAGGPVVINLSRNSISSGSKFKIKNKNLLETSKMLNKDGTIKSKPTKKESINDLNLDLNYKTPRCHMTFIFDPNGRLSYWMGFVVSLAFLYNFWVMIYRFAFNEINSKNKIYWFTFDYFADLLYICDILFNFRTGFLEEGVLQTDPIRLRHHYMNTTRFYVDCLCLMPLDILYLSVGYKSIFRCFRLVKIYRFWGFLDRTERHTNFPNLFRTIVMLHYLFAIFHWNACLSYFLSRYLSEDLMIKNNNQAFALIGNSNVSSSHNHYHRGHVSSGENIFISSGQNQELLRDYLKAFYLSTKIMTLVSEVPNPKTSQDYLFAIFQLILALLLFANIMGHVGYIVSNLGNARKEFQSKLDAVKTYMSLRRVPQRLQDRVIRWFDFLWTNHKSIDDNQILNLLPYKLRAEIAIHVHLDTLKRVEIFQNTEAGFLNELVLRLKPVLYSPGDYICRKGEVGKEMYIVNGGRLQVISDDGKIVLATLKAGSYFGEISILNMGSSGNRRTASVKSVGYSDLFCLSKEDLWEVLKEYPAVRVKLEAIAVKRLEKHKKPLSELVNISRCKSFPGLIDASMSVMNKVASLKRHGTLPTSLLKRTDLSYILSNSNKKSNQIINDTHKKNLEKFDRLLTSKIDDKKSPNDEKNTNIIKERDQSLIDQHNQLKNSTRVKNSIINELYDNSSSSYEHPSTPTSLNINSFSMGGQLGAKTSLSATNSYSLTHSNGAVGRGVSPCAENQHYSVQSQHIDNFYLLREIERLKNCIYYLEGENLALNLKLDKAKHQNHQPQQQQQQKNQRHNKDCDNIILKAKQESDQDDIR